MKRLMPYFFIGPALLALVALVVYPLLYGVYISFFKTNLANKWDFVGLKNYISVFSDGVFVKQLGVTLKFTAIVVLAHFISGNVVKPEQTWNHIFSYNSGSAMAYARSSHRLDF